MSNVTARNKAKVSTNKVSTYNKEIANRSGKIKARKLFMEFFNDVRTPKDKYLGLPAANCKIEKMINKVSPKTNMVLCEYDEKVYSKMQKEASKFKSIELELVRGPIQSKIYNAKRNEYGVCFFDYCGLIGTFKDEVLHAINKKIVKKNGLLAFTFNRRIVNGSTMELAKEMERLNPSGRRGKNTHMSADDCIRTFFLRSIGMDYKIEDYYKYGYSIHEAKMVLVILRRLK